MSTLLRKGKIAGLPKLEDFHKIIFGRQIELFPKLNEFKERAKHTWICQKRRSNAAAIREFKDLYRPKEWLAEYHDDPNYRDDGFQVWYVE